MKKPNGGYRTYEEMGPPRTSRWSMTARAAAACTACSSEPAKQPLRDLHVRGVHAGVEVDMETGEAKGVKFSRRRPMSAPSLPAPRSDGEIYGGLAQGIGLALTEDFDDLEVHTTLRDCGIPYPKHIRTIWEILYRPPPRPMVLRPSWRWRSAADNAAPGDPQRHLQCLRRAHPQCAGEAAEVIKLQLDAKRAQAPSAGGHVARCCRSQPLRKQRSITAAGRCLCLGERLRYSKGLRAYAASYSLSLRGGA